MDKELLQKLQMVEFGILTDLDAYCRKWKIKYSLYGGTMLGAVRHGGFIPWDDDIDIAMTRREYSKFCRAISLHPMRGYCFYNYENDKDILCCHGKVGKSGTLFLEEGSMEGKGHHEIWVDIFPLDKIALDGQFKKETVNIGKELVLLTRANGLRSNDSLKKWIVRRLIRTIPAGIRHKRMLKDTRRLRVLDRKIQNNYEWADMSAIEYISKLRYPKKMPEEYTELTFNGKQFMSFADYEEMLTIMYGDYMQLPPEEERVCGHSPVKIEF